VDFKPKKTLFDLYELPVRREAVGDISVDLNVSETMVSTDLKISMEQLLKADQNDFNLDINHLHVHAIYDIDKNSVQAKSDLLLTTPYGKDVAVTNLFTMDQNISYSGEIHADQFKGVDEKFIKPLNNLQVKYQGDIQSIQADIVSDNIKGTFSSPDFKKAELHLENKQPLVLNAFMALPAELNQTKANIRIDAPLSFEENGTMSLYAKIDSDVLNIDANATYKKILQLNTIASIPKDSPLYTYNQEVKWNSLSPMKSTVTLRDNTIDALLTAGTISVNTQYDLNTTQIDGNVILGGLKADVSGIVDKKMTVDTRINSMNTLIDSVKSVYTLGDVPIVKGSADISMGLTEMKALDVTLKSPEIIYQADHKTEQHVNDIDLALHIEDQTVVLERYALEFAGQKLFSTKASTVTYDDENVSIAPLWINDQLKVEGEYNLQTRKGTIDTKAEKLHIAHEIVDLDSAINIRTLLDGNETSVNGEITLLGGNIHYNLEQKTYASDSDIIIVQEMKKEEPSPFMDGLSTSVQIKTKEPLIYKKGNVDIKADVDINVYKAEGSDLLVLGSVELLKGGSYTFEGKKFILNKSHVYFTGNPNKPLLDVSVDYKSLHHLITIMVTGSANTPNITFSSKPTLTKEQILSVILFGSESGAGTNSGEDMMKMMGGAMAKSALSDLGVQLDYLAFGAGNSVEVGKKLTDDITIIYVNDEISSVKLKYDHGVHTQSVIGVSEESQSYDILYKKDF
jgi:translocation and assembly module TamB